MQTAHNGGIGGYRHIQRTFKLLRSSPSVCRSQTTSTPEYGTLPVMDTPVRARKLVVTAIIRRDSDGKLLLVKRSDKVGSYQQYWGGVSGGVEGNESLLHRALQEISEEVGLSPHQLQLVTCGRPLPVDDGVHHFLVYPFLFNLMQPAAPLTLNWENVAYDWVAASAVPQLQHVPLLPETVRRLLLPPYMSHQVQYLKTDRQHGAAELAAYVLQALRSVLAYEECSAHQSLLQVSRAPAAAAAADIHIPQQQQQQQQQQGPHEATFDHWMEAITTLCFQMAVARPSMAAVGNAAADVMLQLQQELEARAEPFEPTAGCARLALSDALDKLTASMQRQQAAAVSNTAAVLTSGMCVLTTSLSSTVAKALIQAHQKALEGAAAATAAQEAQQQQQQREQVAASLAAGALASDAAAGAAAIEGLTQGGQGQDWVEADWVDDPNFWPEGSGIGRDQPSTSNTTALLSQGISQGTNGQSSVGGSGSFKGSSRGPGVSVIVCESRPLCEGVTMAQRLAAAGLHVTLITDAQAGVFVEQADIVLLGADAVTPAGVVNKVGSRLLALAAKATGVPVVSVTDSLKVSPGPVAHFALPNTALQVGQEEKETSELFSAWGQDVAAAVTKLQTGPHDSQQAQQQPQQQQQQAGDSSISSSSSRSPAGSHAGADASVLAPGGSIEVRNVYFEAVPLSLVSAVITDKGVMDKAQVASLMETRAKGYEQAFGLKLSVELMAA